MRRPTILAPVLAVLLLVATTVAATPVAALTNRASIVLGTRYLLRANLDFAAGTIRASEKIVIKNKSGSAISKVNLSVTPRAFGELTSIGRFTVDDRAVSARWTNNSNDQTIYYKAAAFLDTLRIEMGSDAFFSGLRALFEANRNGMITSREFYDAMAARGASTTTMQAFLSL